MERFFSWLSRLQQKPDQTKKRISLAASLVIIFFIFGTWAFLKSERTERPENNVVKEKSETDGAFLDLKEGVARVMESLEAMKEFRENKQQ